MSNMENFEDFTIEVPETIPEQWRELIDYLNNTVVEQERAVRKLIRRAMVVDAGLKESEGAPSPLFFVGPPGSGKSMLAKEFALKWIGPAFKDPEGNEILPYVQIAGEKYIEYHRISELIGSPAGYIGSGGSPGHERTPSPLEMLGRYDLIRNLTIITDTVEAWMDHVYEHEKEAWQEDPKLKTAANVMIHETLNEFVNNELDSPSSRGVLLIEEFEKMHPNIQRAFLTALEDGYFALANGEEIDLRKVLIIFTSNIASDEITQLLRNKEAGRGVYL